jgi:hypothetical protein
VSKPPKCQLARRLTWHVVGGGKDECLEAQHHAVALRQAGALACGRSTGGLSLAVGQQQACNTRATIQTMHRRTLRRLGAGSAPRTWRCCSGGGGGGGARCPGAAALGGGEQLLGTLGEALAQGSGLALRQALDQSCSKREGGR